MNYLIYSMQWTRDSSVGIVKVFGLDHPGVESWQGENVFLFLKTSIPSFGPAQWVLFSTVLTRPQGLS
jgi:hypothetical protein